MQSEPSKEVQPQNKDILCSKKGSKSYAKRRFSQFKPFFLRQHLFGYSPRGDLTIQFSVLKPKLCTDTGSLQELLKSNKQHWLRVRRHHVSRQHRRLNQFRQRLAALIPDPALEVSSPKSIHKISRYSLAAQQPTNQGRNGTSNQAVGLGRNNELKAAEQSQSVRVSLNSNSNSLQGGSEPMVIEIDRSSASRSPPMSSMLVAEETILE